MAEPQYIEDGETIEIPPAAGVAGYVRVFQAILELPRVQRVEVVPGKIEYVRFVKDGERRPIEVDLETVLPYGIIRNRPVIELVMDELMSAAVALGQMFAQVHMDGMFPIALVAGVGTLLHTWYANTTGVVQPSGSVHGLPVLLDRHLGVETLVMCAGNTPKAPMVDTACSYKTTILWRPKT